MMRAGTWGIKLLAETVIYLSTEEEDLECSLQPYTAQLYRPLYTHTEAIIRECNKEISVTGSLSRSSGSPGCAHCFYLPLQ